MNSCDEIAIPLREQKLSGNKTEKEQRIDKFLIIACHIVIHEPCPLFITGLNSQTNYFRLSSLNLIFNVCVRVCVRTCFLCVCVCVCVSESERDREKQRETKKDRV